MHRSDHPLKQPSSGAASSRPPALRTRCLSSTAAGSPVAAHTGPRSSRRQRQRRRLATRATASGHHRYGRDQLPGPRRGHLLRQPAGRQVRGVAHHAVSGRQLQLAGWLKAPPAGCAIGSTCHGSCNCMRLLCYSCSYCTLQHTVAQGHPRRRCFSLHTFRLRARSRILIPGSSWTRSPHGGWIWSSNTY